MNDIEEAGKALLDCIEVTSPLDFIKQCDIEKILS